MTVVVSLEIPWGPSTKLNLLKLTAVCLMEPLGLLVALSMKQAESRCRLIRLTAPSEKVTSMLLRLWPQANCRIVPEGMLLTPELLLRLSMMLVKLQKQERLSILPQGLLILLLHQ